MWNSYYHHFILCGAAPTSNSYFTCIFKPVEPVLDGQPVLSGQLAIPQEWPFNTGLTVCKLLGSCILWGASIVVSVDISVATWSILDRYSTDARPILDRG